MNPDNIIDGSFAVRSASDIIFHIDTNTNELTSDIDMRLNNHKIILSDSKNLDAYIRYSPTTDSIQFSSRTGFEFSSNTSNTMKWDNIGSWSGGGTLTWNSDGSNNIKVLVSSIQNKTNILAINVTIDDIMKMKPVQYEDLCMCECPGCSSYRKSIIDNGYHTCPERITLNCSNPNSKISYGFIAEDIEKISNLKSMLLYETIDTKIDPRGKRPYSIKYHELGTLAILLSQHNQRLILDLYDKIDKLSKKKN